MNKPFFKSSLGIVLIGGLLVVVVMVGIILFGGSAPKKNPGKDISGNVWVKKEAQIYEDPAVSYGQTKKPEAMKADVAADEAQANGKAPAAIAGAGKGTAPRETPKVATGIRVFSTKREVNPETEMEQILATKKITPYGRLIKCALINAVDSINLESPVIGYVTEPLLWDNKVIIPANTEVHGMAKGVGHLRDRIGCDSKWTLVLREPKYKNRRELILEGIVLDKEYNPENDSYGLTDGSAGLKGVVIDNSESKEFKLFLATFISGMSSGFQSTQTNGYGSVEVLPSAKNAALGGASSVMNEYANQVREAIQRDGAFVRVYAAKEFYIYVKQDIDLEEAKIGNKALEAYNKKKR
jgi:hypothetical protein